MTASQAPKPMAWGDVAVTDVLAAIGARAPLVHCLTNIVVAGFTANVLLAAGASPAMVENIEEAGPFAAVAGGVLINLGTLSGERATAMTLAAASAHDHRVPWILDPVAAGALAHRTKLAVDLLESAPTVIRGNGSEILALAGAAGATTTSGGGGRGVDSLVSSDGALGAAVALARTQSCVVAVSGATDYVTNGKATLAVVGGHPLMTRVTGVGCALGSLMAATSAVGAEPLIAAAVASAIFAEAGQRAAMGAAGPGSFAVAFLDALAALADEAAPA